MTRNQLSRKQPVPMAVVWGISVRNDAVADVAAFLQHSELNRRSKTLCKCDEMRYTMRQPEGRE